MKFDYKKHLWVMQLFFGLAIIFILWVYVFQNINILLSSIDRINIAFFFLAILSYEGINLSWILRIRYLLAKYKYLLSPISIAKAQFSGMLLGDITPGKAGYLYVSKMLKRYNVPYKVSISILMISQVIDLILKGICAIFGVIMLFSRYNFSIIFIIFSIIFLSCLLILCLEKFPNIVKNLPIFKKYSKYFDEFRKFNRNTIRYFLEISVFYFIGWFFAGLQWFFLSKALGINLSYTECLFLHPLITSLSFVPITPAGLGIVESGGIGILYILASVSLNNAFLFLITARITNLLGDFPGVFFVLEELKRK